MVENAKAVELLAAQVGSIGSLRNTRDKEPEFEKWWSKSKSIVSNLFGEKSPEYINFAKISFRQYCATSRTTTTEHFQAYLSGLTRAEAQLLALKHTVETFWPEATVLKAVDDKLSNLISIISRFHTVARQLRDRHSNRPTLEINDEYDVQDLFHALLKIHFNDIRSEEVAPSYAGGSSRMDFLLKDEKLVVELKKTSQSLGAKEIGGQLLVDIQR